MKAGYWPGHTPELTISPYNANSYGVLVFPGLLAGKVNSSDAPIIVNRNSTILMTQILSLNSEGKLHNESKLLLLLVLNDFGTDDFVLIVSDTVFENLIFSLLFAKYSTKHGGGEWCQGQYSSKPVSRYLVYWVMTSLCYAVNFLP